MGRPICLHETQIVLVKCAKTKLEYVGPCWIFGCCKGAELHLPRILVLCHQRHCSRRKRDFEDKLMWLCKVDRRTALQSSYRWLGETYTESCTWYRLAHFGVIRTCENWTPGNWRWEYEGCRLAPRNKWVGLAFRRKPSIWAKAGILTYCEQSNILWRLHFFHFKKIQSNQYIEVLKLGLNWVKPYLTKK